MPKRLDLYATPHTPSVAQWHMSVNQVFCTDNQYTAALLSGAAVNRRKLWRIGKAAKNFESKYVAFFDRL